MDATTLKNMFEYDSHAQDWSQAMTQNVGHKFLEKPAMVRELPQNFAGQCVLCIGVGSGEELQEILKRSPQHVTAIDVSNELLKIARRNFPSVEFLQMDMMDLHFPNESFDFVYSSLALHYAKSWEQVLGGIHRVLKKKGTLLFSTHNPKFWAQFPKTGNSHVSESGVCAWEHTAPLPGNITAIYYNVSEASVIQDCVETAGFQVENFDHPDLIDVSEWVSEAEKKDYCTLKELNESTSLFLLVKAQKNQIGE